MASLDSRAVLLVEAEAKDPATLTRQTFHWTVNGAYRGAGRPGVYEARRVLRAVAQERAADGRRGLFGVLGGEPAAARIDNTDEALTPFIGWGWDGGRYRVLLAEHARQPYAETTVLLDTTIAQRRVGFENTAGGRRSELQLALRAGAADLDAPLFEASYAGDNVLPDGLEGTPGTVGGQTKTAVFGRVDNMSPVEVNTARHVYDVGPGDIAAAVGDRAGVYDGGVPFERATDYADLQDLYDNPPQPAADGTATYRVLHHTDGRTYLRLAQAPAAQVTADVARGATRGAEVAAAVAAEAGLSTDADDLAAVDAAAPHAVALAPRAGASARDLLDQLAPSLGIGFWVEGGVLRMARLTAPGGTPVLTLRRYARTQRAKAGDVPLLDFRVVAARDAASGLPPRSVALEWGPNPTPQGPDALLGDPNDPDDPVGGGERRAWLRRTTPPAEAPQALRELHDRAEPLVQTTVLRDEADALAERDARRDLLAREAWRAEAVAPLRPAVAAALRYGALVRVVEEGIGLEAGRLMRVVGWGLDGAAGDTVATLDLWG